MKLKLKILALFTCLSFPVFGQDLSCPSSLSVEQIAISLMKIELSGIRLEEMQGNGCLDQSQFPHILIVEDFSNEAPSELAGTVADMSDVSLINVKQIDSDVHLYEAQFELKVERVQGLSVLVKEKIQFFLNKTPETQKTSGCASTTERTQQVYLLKKCQK